MPNKTKKILFIITQSEFGGAQRFLWNLISGLTQISTQKDADANLLYEDETYKIRGACFKVWKEFGGAFKEKIVDRALEEELKNQGLNVEGQKRIDVYYSDKKIGTYIPDKIVNDSILLEIKCKPFLTKGDERQFWLYLKGSKYRLGLLINFGSEKLEIKRRIYDKAREKRFISVDPRSYPRKSASIDYEVVVAAGPEGDDEQGLLSALEKKGINTKHLKYLKRDIDPLFDFLGLIEIHRLIKKEKPNTVFLCSSKAGVLGSLATRLYLCVNQRSYLREAKRSASIKIIYRIGGWTFNDPWPIWKKKLYILLEKWSAKFKDVIINNAESDRQLAIKLGIKPKEKIVTIYNGIDVQKLEIFSKERARDLLGIKNGFIVGTIASFYPTKGLKYLIEAGKILKDKDIKFILIGEGQEKEEIENLIKNYNLSEKFVLIKPTYKDYIYLKAFDVFVLPSVKEGFPWVILEAMAAEIPVIATKVGAIPEVIDNGKNGILIDSRNPEQIKQAINKLLDDESLRNKLAKEGRKTVVEKFSLDKMVKEIEKLF